MNEEYYLYFTETHTHFNETLGDVLSKLKSVSYWKDFETYHYPSVEKWLSDIMVKSTDKGHIISDNSTTQNGIVFTVDDMTISTCENMFDITMEIPNFYSYTNLTIEFKKLAVKLKYGNVEFRHHKLEFSKDNYSESDWKVLEKALGFKEAINMYIHGPLIITGYGVADNRKDK